MAKRKYVPSDPCMTEVPENLNDHSFFGIKTNPGQTIFRDAIWNSKNKIVFCNAVAGSGKTLIAAASAVLMVKTGQFDEIVYLASPINNDREGFLPGTAAEKGKVFFTPFFQALQKIGVNINTSLHTEDLLNEKNGTAFITCMTDTYIRGMNIGEPDGSTKSIYILDESQNMNKPNMVKNPYQNLQRLKSHCNRAQSANRFERSVGLRFLYLCLNISGAEIGVRFVHLRKIIEEM